MRENRNQRVSSGAWNGPWDSMEVLEFTVVPHGSRAVQAYAGTHPYHLSSVYFSHANA